METSLRKFERCLALTRNDSDAEALLALRQAQRIAGGDILEFLKKNLPSQDHTELLTSYHREVEQLKKKVAFLHQKLAEGQKQKPPRGSKKEQAYEARLTFWLLEYWKKGGWEFIPVAELKGIFEGQLEEDNISYPKISTKRFSQIVAEVLQVVQVKGGRRKQERGFFVSVR